MLWQRGDSLDDEESEPSIDDGKEEGAEGEGDVSDFDRDE